MCEKIEYYSEDGYRAVLYDYHEVCLYHDKCYQMSVFRPDGLEIMHAYNAAPKTIAELKKVVEFAKGMVGT